VSSGRKTIAVTPEQHQRLKAIAALSDQTIKDYILERALPSLPEMESLSVEQIFEEVRRAPRP
jgi:uncharacterized protein (DUF1778 family)